MACESEHRQTNTHKERKAFDSWMGWVFLFLAKITIGCHCTMWVAAVQEGSLQVVSCFVSTSQLAWAVHQSSSLCRICPLPGETFLRKGAIGPAESNISTTEKIIEHVTNSYHIDCLKEMNLWHLRDNAISNYCRNATSLGQPQAAFFHRSPCSRIS